MARHGTPSAPRQVNAAFICVILAGVPAPIRNPCPLTHSDSSGSLKPAMSQAEFGNISVQLSVSQGCSRRRVLETRKKWGVLFEYLQSYGTWGIISEDVIPSLRGGGRGSTGLVIHSLSLSDICTTFGDILPLRALVSQYAFRLFPRMRAIDRYPTQIIGIMGRNQSEGTSRLRSEPIKKNRDST